MVLRILSLLQSFRSRAWTLKDCKTLACLALLRALWAIVSHTLGVQLVPFRVVHSQLFVRLAL